MMKRLTLWNQKLLWCLLLYGMAALLSCWHIVTLKEGGSWTLFSLLPLWLITYFFGVRTGALWSFLFSFAKLGAAYLTENLASNEFGWQVFLLEYVIACTLFCIGGFFPQNRRTQTYIKERKAERKLRHIQKAKELKMVRDETDSEEWYDPFFPEQTTSLSAMENTRSGLILGYITGVVLMFICYFIAAMFFYPEEYIHVEVSSIQDIIWYNIKYDGSYLLMEAIVTVIILCVPSVQNAIFYLKHMANNDKEDYSIHGF